MYFYTGFIKDIYAAEGIQVYIRQKVGKGNTLVILRALSKFFKYLKYVMHISKISSVPGKIETLDSRVLLKSYTDKHFEYFF